MFITGRSLDRGSLRDRGGHPGRALASKALRSPKRGRWNTLSVRAARRGGPHVLVGGARTGGPLYLRAGSWPLRQSALPSTPPCLASGGVAHRFSQRLVPGIRLLRGTAQLVASRGTSPPPAGSTPPGGSAPPPGSAGGGAGPPVRNCAGPEAARQPGRARRVRPAVDEQHRPPAGTALTTSSGFTASTPGAVYNALNVNGSIYITANNVTIQNSNITDVDPDNAAIQIANGVTGMKILYDSIHGTNTASPGRWHLRSPTSGRRSTALRWTTTNFYNGDRILTGYGTITNSYCLGGANFNSSSGSEEHDECIYTDGGAPGIRAIHDTLLVDNAPDRSDLRRQSGLWRGWRGWDAGRRELDSRGRRLLPLRRRRGEQPHTGSVTIKNNRFSRIFYSNCGQYGTDAHFTTPSRRGQATSGTTRIAGPALVGAPDAGPIAVRPSLDRRSISRNGRKARPHSLRSVILSILQEKSAMRISDVDRRERDAETP